MITILHTLGYTHVRTQDDSYALLVELSEDIAKPHTSTTAVRSTYLYTSGDRKVG